MKKIILFIVGCSFFACSTPKYFYDYDQQANFSFLKTYAFFSEMDTGLSELDEDRFTNAIDSVLQSKGIQESSNPDFKINFYTSYYQTPSQQSIGIGLGGGGGNMGMGVSGGIPIGGMKTYINLTLEFVEQPNNILIWQGIAEARFNPEMPPEERNAFFHKIAIGILKKYPPKK